MCTPTFGDEKIQHIEEETPAVLLTNLQIDTDASSLFNESKEIKDQNFTANQIHEEKQLRNYRVILYGHGELILPGIGIGLRTYHNGIGVEYNAALFLTGGKGSVSVFKQWDKDNQWYAGAGLGIFNEIFRNTFLSPYIPFFIGYEGKKTFGDIGIDCTFISGFLPIPTFRFGIRF